MSNPILSVQEIKALDLFTDAFNNLDTLLETVRVNKKVSEALLELKKAFLQVRETSYRKALIDLLAASGVELDADAQYSDTDLLLLAHTTATTLVQETTQAHRNQQSDDGSSSDSGNAESELYVEPATVVTEASESDEVVEAEAIEENAQDEEKDDTDDHDDLDIFAPEAQQEDQQVEGAQETEEAQEEPCVVIDPQSAELVDDEDQKVEEHSHSQDAARDESDVRPPVATVEVAQEKETQEDRVFVTAPVTTAPPVTKPVDNFFARLSSAPTLRPPAAARTIDHSPSF